MSFYEICTSIKYVIFNKSLVEYVCRRKKLEVLNSSGTFVIKTICFLQSGRIRFILYGRNIDVVGS